MAETTRLAKALIEFGADNAEFNAVIQDTAKRLSGLTKNFKETGTHLDGMVAGMSAAGKEASASGKLIAGMSQSGRTELARLATAGQQPVSAFQSLIGALGPIPTMIAGAFSVTAILGFAREIGSFADRIVNLSDETRISTSRLQAWDYVLTDAGLTVEDMVRAATELQKRLGTDDNGAAGSMRDLGLSAAELIQMRPDEAVIRIVEATAKLGTQSEQTSTLFELLGKVGPRLLRLNAEELRTLIDDVSKSNKVVREDMLRSVDSFGDDLSRMYKQMKVQTLNFFAWYKDQYNPTTTPILPAAPIQPVGAGPTITGPTKDELRALDEQAAKLREHASAFEAHQKQLAALAQELSGAKAIAAAKDLQAAFLSLTPAQRANEQTIAAVNDQYEKLLQRVGLGVVPVLDKLYQAHGLVTDRGRALAQQLMLTRVEVDVLEPAVGDLIPPLLETSNAIDMNTQQLARATFSMGQYGVQADSLARVTIPSVWQEIDTMARSMEQLANVSGPTMGTVARGIGTVTAATSTAHTSWGTLTKGFDSFSKKGGGVTEMLGGLSSIVGGIGGIVAAAQMAAQAIKALFNAFKSEESLKVNKPRDAFQDQYGGVTGMGNQILDTLMGQGLSYEEAEAKRKDLVDGGLNAARTEADFQRAQDAIIALIGGNRFAAGGIVTRATAGIFGEAGPEAVIPLDRLSSFVGNQRPIEITVVSELDGREVARNTVRHIPRELAMAGLA
jgi:hypothetical protein